MPLLPEKLLTPEEEELQRKKASLAQLEAQLAERELELASCRADLSHFEQKYMQSIGRRYAILDGLRAQIAEARAKQNPNKTDAQDQARQARSQARESARAVGDADGKCSSPEDPASATKPNRSESLKKLYRQAARLLHPDLTLDPDEKEKRHHLMAEVNAAYQRGDEERIRTILNEWHASPDNLPGEGPGAELVRIIRKIAQVERRLKSIADEIVQFRQGGLFKLKQQVEEAHGKGIDLLKQLAERLDHDIVIAREEVKQTTKTGTS
jgi:hypothetical protein